MFNRFKCSYSNTPPRLPSLRGGIWILLLLLMNIHFVFAREIKWSGIDENVVEKIAQEHGRPAWTPFINTDQGDLLLFVFLLAGTAGGFMVGFCWRKLFYPPKAEAPAVGEKKK